MKVDRLFHVLVVMSTAPALTACGTDDDDTSQRGGEQGSGSGSGSGSGELALCFCDTEACCDRSTSEPVLADGFECCWSTTCP